MIPFPPFEPDKSPFNEGASDNAVNAIPVADGWGPFASFNEISSSLGERCYGAIVGRNTAGNYSIFAFTKTAIKKFVQGTSTWADVTRTSGLYNLQDGDKWSVLQFGPYIVASNIGDAMQVFNLDTDLVFSDLPGSPPQAKFIWTCGGYLFAGNTTDGADRIYNSGLEDIGQWTIGEQGADYQPGGGAGDVQGGIGDQFGGYVFYSDRIRRITLTAGQQYTYSLTDVNTARATVAPYSIVSIGPNDFIHYCEDGWFRGPNSTPIGAQRIDEWFTRTIDQGQVRFIQGAADPVKKMAWFSFAKADGGYQVLGYHWQLDRWTTIQTEQTLLVPLSTSGFTLEDIGALYPSIEDVPYSFDSYVWLGGRPTFAGFSVDGSFGFFSGSNMAVTLETALVSHNYPNRSFVNGVRPIVDGSGAIITIGTRSIHQSDTVWGTASAVNLRTGVCPFRSSARLHKYRLSMPEGASWSFIHGVEPVFVAEGAQ